VWAIRGLSIAQILVKNPEEISHSVELFSRILRAAEQGGVLGATRKSSTRKAAKLS